MTNNLSSWLLHSIWSPIISATLIFGALVHHVKNNPTSISGAVGRCACQYEQQARRGEIVEVWHLLQPASGWCIFKGDFRHPSYGATNNQSAPVEKETAVEISALNGDPPICETSVAMGEMLALLAAIFGAVLASQYAVRKYVRERR